MKVRIRMKKGLSFPHGSGSSLSFLTGNLDEATGLLWTDENQGNGKSLPPGCFVHLASQTTGQRLDLPPPAKSAPKEKAAS
jgi:hypothetical protein